VNNGSPIPNTNPDQTSLPHFSLDLLSICSISTLISAI